jgi:D-3-phosphoglycerate dehydrogenase / 2-oxoglutarate reductase
MLSLKVIGRVFIKIPSVLLATEKAFGKSAVDAIEDELSHHGYNLVKLENYKNKQDLLKAIAEVDACIVRSDICDKEVFDAAVNLKVLVRAGAGVDTIDLEYAKQKGVVVMNTPGQNSNAVAELAFGMMIYHARSKFDGGMGTELRGKTLGLHGCGNVSKFMIHIAKGFGMTVKAYDPYLTADQINGTGAHPGTIEDIYSCQYVSLHIPLTDQTRGSINARLLNNMPNDGILINTARPEVIHEEDLLTRLHGNKNFAYLSDVTPSNLSLMQERMGNESFKKQVFVTPKKMGAQTIEANNNCAPAAAKQIVRFFEHKDTRFQVNL